MSTSKPKILYLISFFYLYVYIHISLFLLYFPNPTVQTECDTRSIFLLLDWSAKQG